jgi:hypothetical protein
MLLDLSLHFLVVLACADARDEDRETEDQAPADDNGARPEECCEHGRFAS